MKPLMKITKQKNIQKCCDLNEACAGEVLEILQSSWESTLNHTY